MNASQIISLVTVVLVVFGSLVGYIIRIERALSTMGNDIGWIKRNCEKCQHTSDENTP